MSKLFLAQDPAADELLAEDPLALLIGMLLDQQIPLEKGFKGPHVMATRMGVSSLDAAKIADYDPAAFAEMFATVPAIHRFPGSMAERTQKLCRAIVEDYDGDAESVWRTAHSGAELFTRLSNLPGFGTQKAQIFVALLAKQFQVALPGWRAVAGAYGEDGSLRSVADIVDKDSLTKVREFKKQMKAAAKADK